MAIVPWDDTIGEYASVLEEPLTSEEWRVLAHWLEYYPSVCGMLALGGDHALLDAVRVAVLRYEIHAALLLARNPQMTLAEAQRQAKPFLSLAPDRRH